MRVILSNPALIDNLDRRSRRKKGKEKKIEPEGANARRIYSTTCCVNYY